MNSAPTVIPDVQKIAVLRANALGDFIFSLPALHALRTTYPEAEITLLCAHWHPRLLAGRPGPVDRAIPLPPMRGITSHDPAAPGLEAHGELIVALQRERFDLAIQAHGGGAHSNPLVLSMRPRVTVGLRDTDALPLDRWLRYVYLQSEVIRQLEVMRLVGAINPGLPTASVPVVESDRQAAAAAVGTDDRPIAVLHPGASDPRRRWPPRRFAAVARHLARDSMRVLVTGTAAEHEVIKAVCAESGGCAEPAGRLSLPALVGLLASARIMISNDTGPLHLANAVGTPTVGLYWAVNLINAGSVTRELHRPVVAWRIHCPLCGTDCIAGDCSHSPSFIDEIDVEQVLTVADVLLEDTDDLTARKRTVYPTPQIDERPTAEALT